MKLSPLQARAELIDAPPTNQPSSKERTMLKRIIARALVLLVLLTGGVVAISAPASAAYSDCPAGQSCLWSGENGAGTRLNLAFSNYDPVGTCHDLPFHPVGGWHSAKGGFGSGYSLLLYSGSGGGCTGVVMATLGNGQTWSSAFSRPYSVKIL